MRRLLRSPGAGDLLALVVQVGVGPVALALDALGHRVEGVGGMADGVVGVDRQKADAAVGVVAVHVEHAVVPREGVGAVVAGPIDDGRLGVPAAQRLGPAGGCRQVEVGGPLADRNRHALLLFVAGGARQRRTHIVGVGQRGSAAVGPTIDAAGETRRLVVAGRVHVLGVHADRRRAGKALALRVGLALDARSARPRPGRARPRTWRPAGRRAPAPRRGTPPTTGTRRVAGPR